MGAQETPKQATAEPRHHARETVIRVPGMKPKRITWTGSESPEEVAATLRRALKG
jgi:hypothetical protein